MWHLTNKSQLSTQHTPTHTYTCHRRPRSETNQVQRALLHMLAGYVVAPHHPITPSPYPCVLALDWFAFGIHVCSDYSTQHTHAHTSTACYIQRRSSGNVQWGTSLSGKLLLCVGFSFLTWLVHFRLSTLFETMTPITPLPHNHTIRLFTLFKIMTHITPSPHNRTLTSRSPHHPITLPVCVYVCVC